MSATLRWRRARDHKARWAPWAVAGVLVLTAVGAQPAAALTDPDAQVTTPATNGAAFPTVPIGLAGTASDDVGVSRVALKIRKPATAEFWDGRGWTDTDTSVQAVLAAPGATSTAWTYAFTPPAPGSFSVLVTASDVEGRRDATPPYRTFSLAPPANPAPFVSVRLPRSGATGVQPSTSVSVTFSEPVLGVGPATFTLAPATGGAPVAASITRVGTSDEYVLDPAANLATGTSYRASLVGGPSAIRDASGVPLVSGAWTFTTVAGKDPVPFVSARSPFGGETGVPRATTVSVTFSEPVQGVSATTFQLRTTAGGQTVAATVARVGTTNEYVLDPGADLAALTSYTATVTGGATAVRDATGQALATTSWSFTTVSTQNPAPFITSRSPRSGATAVAPSTNVVVTFSEAVLGVSASTFTLAPTGGAPVAATVTQGAGNQFVLDPSASLARATSYTVALAGGPAAIRDTSGAPLPTVSWSFTTG